jgi:hypothetical protein
VSPDDEEHSEDGDGEAEGEGEEEEEEEDTEDEDEDEDEDEEKYDSRSAMEDKSLVAPEGEEFVDLDYDRKQRFAAGTSSETAIDFRSAVVEALIAAGSDVACLNVSRSSLGCAGAALV